MVAAGVFCGQFVIARSVCARGLTSCAAFRLSVYSFRTAEGGVFPSPACRAGVERQSLAFPFNAQALGDFRGVVSAHKTPDKKPER